MINTNPIEEKHLAQKDEDLIKNIAGEMNSKDKKNNKSQSEIEEQIEQGYIRLKADINKTLTPILQAMIEAGADGGLVSTLELEIYSDARKTFFSSVINSDISNMEVISQNVQKESLKQLTPLFEEGEVSQDVSQLKQIPPVEYDIILNDMLDDKEDIKKIIDKEEVKPVIFADSPVWLLTRENAYKKAFGKNAKDEDKNEMMAIYTLRLLYDKINAGTLKDDEREFVISAINELMEFGDRYKTDICIAVEKLGITNEELSENVVKLVNDFRDEEDARIEEEIAGLIDKLKDASDKGLEEQRNAIEEIKKEKYGIDAITRIISERTNYSEPLNDYQKDIVRAGIDMFKDPNAQMEIDGFVYLRMLDVLRYTYKSDPKLYVDLFQAFNSRIPENSPKLTDALMEAVISDNSYIIELWDDSSGFYGKEGCKNVADKLSEKTEAKTLGRDDERLLEDLKYGIAFEGQTKGKEAAHVYFDAIKDRYSPKVVAEMQKFLDSNEYKKFDISLMKERRENLEAIDNNYVQGYLKNMNTMMKEQGTKGLKEYIDSLLEHSKNKEEVIDATLKYFEQEKENNDKFDEKENAELRKDIYVSILVCGMDNPEIYERMRQIDRETAKIVVKESLQEINDSRNFYNGLLESVQKLGKGLNERVEPIVEDAILDADKTALPKVDLLPKEKEGWEPGD